MIGTRSLALGLVAVAACLLVAPARAETRLYVIAVGNNLPPAQSHEELVELRYADDDAAAVYTFAREIGAHATLLTVLDAPSQARFPGLAAVAQPPTLAALRETVAWHRAQLEADRKAGRDPVLLFFFSGHGTAGDNGPAALALLDGGLTQQLLYEEILAQLPARFVHLLIDACHAEAVVRPRDLEAQIVDVTPSDLESYVARGTLARFPQTGAIVAAASDAQSQEWDEWEHGVFTHEVLSGLRGGADVNRDGRIEYSELYAFLAAANREVPDVRARLAIVARPPALDRHAAIVDLNVAPRPARLDGLTAGLGELYIEDEHGNRIADVHAEPGFRVALALPPDRALYVHTRRAEAALRLGAGATMDAARLAFGPPHRGARGALATALHAGLFALGFGPAYYRGFVDVHAELLPVPLWLPMESDHELRRPSRTPAIATSATAGALAAAAVILGGLAGKAASDYNATTFEREATDARRRYDGFTGASIGTGVAAALSAGVATWLWVRARSHATPRDTLPH
jgi:hypothetical protein